MIKRIVVIILLLARVSAFAAQEADHGIHEELRGLLKGIEQAVNTAKYDDLTNYFHIKMRLTTINQEVILAHSDIAPYFRKWFGSGGYLKKLQMNFEADSLTELYGDKTFGIVRGSGTENYTLADGRYFAMKTRWTATVIKDTDGKWRILALHIGTNFLDNPILSKAEGALAYFGAGGMGLGLALGWLVTFLVMRRRRASHPA